MSVYYNDSEPFVCAWLKNLIDAKLLPAGDVDERPIQEVSPDDVRHYTQAHFFAGIGGWVYALQLAGWGDRPVWTGSCPCQPFSAAGKGKAEDDPRHLWPQWFRLIRECRPVRIFGEQVANGVGKGWWDVVSTDLEAEAYTVGSVVLGAHSVGAPHLRQRIWWVADTEGARDDAQAHRRIGGHAPQPHVGGAFLADPTSSGRCGTHQSPEDGNGRRTGKIGGSGTTLADSHGLRQPQPQGSEPHKRRRSSNGSTDLANAQCDRLPGGDVQCAEPHPELSASIGRDSRGHILGETWWTEPDVGRVAYGLSNQMGRLRGYGNAIVPQVAAEFVQAYLECQP